MGRIVFVFISGIRTIEGLAVYSVLGVKANKLSSVEHPLPNMKSKTDPVVLLDGAPLHWKSVAHIASIT
jgi:hypothetical protein